MKAFFFTLKPLSMMALRATVEGGDRYAVVILTEASG
jgi:hypothetical protein